MRYFVLLCLPLAACIGPSYRMDRPADTMPDLHLTKVTVTPTATRISFRYRSDQTRRIGVHAPGAEGAFAIRAAKSTQTYALKGAQGIALLPERTLVEAGTALEFTLTFEPIPDMLREFHVGEGSYDPETGETAWHFRNVKLP